jgi:hypothetical protein
MPTPRYIGNIPGSVAYNKTIPAVVRDTYVQVRGLGLGKTEFSVRMEVMAEVTGKSQSTLFEHLRLLEKCKTLRWSITDSVAILKFFALDSGKSDALLTDSLKLKVNNRNLKKGDSEKSESGSEAARALMEAYTGWIGYDPGRLPAAERQSLEWLAAHFSLEHIQVVYDEYKSLKFWEKKRLPLSYLRYAVPEFYAALDRRSQHAHQPDSPPAGGAFRDVVID